jgi:hypothetical protein
MISPNSERLRVIQAVYDGQLDVNYITDDELTWLENYVMELVVEHYAQTNPMTFSEVEFGLLN